MERIKKYRVSLLFFAAAWIFAEAVSLIPESLRTTTACAAVCMLVFFSLIWLSLWSCATVAKGTHPWVAAFLKVLVVLQMLGSVVIVILAFAGVMPLQFELHHRWRIF